MRTMIPRNFQPLQPDEPTPLYYQLEIALRRQIEAGDFSRWPACPPKPTWSASIGSVGSQFASALSADGGGWAYRAPGAPRGNLRAARKRWTRWCATHDHLSLEEGPPPDTAVSWQSKSSRLEQTEAPAFVSDALRAAPPRPGWCACGDWGGSTTSRSGWNGRYLPTRARHKSCRRTCCGRYPSTVRSSARWGCRPDPPRMRVDAAIATSDEARQLRISKGHPLLVTEQVGLRCRGPAIPAYAVGLPGRPATRSASTISQIERDPRQSDR